MLSEAGARSRDLRLGRYIKLFFVNAFDSIRIFLSNPGFPKCALRQSGVRIFNHTQVVDQHFSILTRFFFNSEEDPYCFLCILAIVTVT